MQIQFIIELWRLVTYGDKESVYNAGACEE